MDPEDLLREEVEDLDLLPVSHRDENMRVLDELTAAGISYKYVLLSALSRMARDKSAVFHVN